MILDPEAVSFSRAPSDAEATASATNFGRSYVAESPFVLRLDQLYYWSRVWQAGEAESRAEISAGAVIRFENTRSAMEWLFSDSDD